MWSHQQDWPHACVLQLLSDQQPAECILASGFVACLCFGSSLTGDLPSAVWPAGLVPHVFVCCGSSLTGDLPSAVWPAGLVPHVFVCCGSSLTSDLPSAVWPAGLVPHVCVLWLLRDLFSTIWPDLYASLTLC